MYEAQYMGGGSEISQQHTTGVVKGMSVTNWHLIYRKLVQGPRFMVDKWEKGSVFSKDGKIMQALCRGLKYHRR